MADNYSPDQLESLRVQLVELNNRGRWYSSQLWQVPFAYLALVGFVLAADLDEAPAGPSLRYMAVAVLGIAVSCHMFGITNGERRAVTNLQKVEEALQIPPTVLYKPGYTRPLLAAVLLTTLGSAAMAVKLLCQVGA